MNGSAGGKERRLRKIESLSILSLTSNESLEGFGERDAMTTTLRGTALQSRSIGWLDRAMRCYVQAGCLLSLASPRTTRPLINPHHTQQAPSNQHDPSTGTKDMGRAAASRPGQAHPVRRDSCSVYFKGGGGRTCPHGAGPVDRRSAPSHTTPIQHRSAVDAETFDLGGLREQQVRVHVRLCCIR